MIQLIFITLTAQAAGHGYGPVDPAPIPDVAVVRHDGRTSTLLQELGTDRAAIQFVFTDCRTACPLLGSLFRNVDRQVAVGKGRLVSISVNPQGDSPARLASWLHTFSASDRWVALRLEPGELARVLAVFGQKSGPITGHAIQVFFAEDGKFLAQTTDLPRASVIASALNRETNVAGINPERAAPRETQVIADPIGELLFDGRQPLAGRVGQDSLASHSAACANCHRGGAGPEGKVAVSSVTRSALTQKLPRRGGPASSYTAESFCTALREGTDPAGVVLSEMMPRYSISRPVCQALWDYLTRP